MNSIIKSVLDRARRAWFLQRKKELRERILRDYRNVNGGEIRQVVDFIKRHPEKELPIGMVPPYDWVEEYSPHTVRVERDSGSGLPFVTVNGRRIFFPRNFTIEEIQNAVSIGQMEQDARSPHRYLGDGFDIDAGDIGVFIGASNGLFCASLIDRLSRAYLFEPDLVWHEALLATFAPWGAKVELSPLFVSDTNLGDKTTLDRFFKERAHPNYIQADVEGAELNVLNGAKYLIHNSQKLRLSICTYHNRNDFHCFERVLSRENYHISHSPGFYFLGVRMPYVRRGILYAARVASAVSK